MEGVGLLVILAVGVISGFVAASIAQAKGHSGAPYFWLGFFLPLIGILVAGFMPASKPVASPHPVSTDVGLAPQSSKPNIPSSPTSAFLTGRAGLTIVDAVPVSADRLPELDAPGTTDVARFVERYSEKLDRMLPEIGMVASGERILAVGEGWWLTRLEVFLLTDSRLIFGHSFGVSSSHWVGGSRPGSDADDDRVLRLRDGTLIIADYSPFRAVDVRKLIASSESAERFIELEPLVGSVSTSDSDRPFVDDSGTMRSLERLDALREEGVIDDADVAELKRRVKRGEEGATGSGE